MSKEESNCIGVNIVNTGKLTDTRINRFKLAQIIKASFLVDFNTARVMINDLFEKLKDPNATYLIKGFNFSKEIFEKMADEHDIEYVYVHERSAIISDINTDTKESNDSYPAALMALSDYIKGLEKENRELSEQLREKELKIASLEQALLNIARSIKGSKNLLNNTFIMSNDILKDFGLEKTLG
ncbi:MAG: hypothetical protein EOM50_08275 [Erysipelotrichia bacterium]|nr:hypothetical protein [Erysipelotrichia bacterium]